MRANAFEADVLRNFWPGPYEKKTRPGSVSPGRVTLSKAFLGYCPISRITKDPGIGVGRGRGLSGVGAAAGLKSAVSV